MFAKMADKSTTKELIEEAHLLVGSQDILWSGLDNGCMKNSSVKNCLTLVTASCIKLARRSLDIAGYFSLF